MSKYQGAEPLSRAAPTEQGPRQGDHSRGLEHDWLWLNGHDPVLRSLDTDSLTQGHQKDTMTFPSTLASFLAAKRISKTWCLFTKGKAERRGQRTEVVFLDRER